MLDRSQLLELSQYRNRERPVVSLYLTLDRTPADDRALLQLKNLIADADERRKGLDHEASQAVAADLHAIRDAARSENGSGAAGIALFICGSELNQQVELPYAVPNEITLSDRPRLRPLLRLLQRYDRYLAILSDARDARLILVRPDRSEELALVEHDTPGRHDQGGWAQARIQRHQDRRVEEHLSKAAQRAFELHQQRPFDGIVLLGTDERTSLLAEQLHPYLRERLLASKPMAMDAKLAAIGETVMQSARTERHKQQQESLDTWRGDLLADNGLAVAGLAATLRAAQQGQVMRLLMDEEFAAAGGKCKQCGALTDEDDGECDYCGGALRPLADIAEAVTVLALEQDAEISFLARDEHPSPLAEYGGIGAILRYASS